MSARTGRIDHQNGRRRAVDRVRPRKSKRDAPKHPDKYAPQPKTEDDLLAESLVELAARFNREEARRGKPLR